MSLVIALSTRLNLLSISSAIASKPPTFFKAATIVLHVLGGSPTPLSHSASISLKQSPRSPCCVLSIAPSIFLLTNSSSPRAFHLGLASHSSFLTHCKSPIFNLVLAVDQNTEVIQLKLKYSRTH